MKSGNLNFLEPPGPLQASNGTAFNIREIELMLLSALCSSHIYFGKCPHTMSAVGTRAMQEFDLGR